MPSVCAVCATPCGDGAAGLCSPSCWTRWVGASPTERRVATADRDARIYGDVAHQGRSAETVAQEVGLSPRTVWQVVQMRRDALSADCPVLIRPDGQPVPAAWCSAVAVWGRPGLVLAAKLLLLGRIRTDDRTVQHYLGMGKHRLSRILNELTDAGITRRTRVRGSTGPVWVHELIPPRHTE